MTLKECVLIIIVVEIDKDNDTVKAFKGKKEHTTALAAADFIGGSD